jgi:glutathione S-transferase
MEPSLKIFGHPASQPSRTVFWVCVMNDLPFSLGDTGGLQLNTGGTNPRGQVPSIVDDGFALAEMSAIVGYLADKHDWVSLYPRDLKVRARIHQFLHMHHHLVRLATFKLMAPHVVKPLGFAVAASNANPLSQMQRDLLTGSLSSQDPLKDGGEVVGTILGFLEKAYFDDASPFVCNTEAVSLADLACYAEIGQLQFAKLFDFTGFPRTRRWLEEMSKIPGHDPIHAYNTQLGDIATQPNTAERFAAASEAGFDALRGTGLVYGFGRNP